MRTKPFLALLPLLLAPFAGAETIASFNGNVPVGAGWTFNGTLPIEVVEDEGRQVVDFKDESETATCGLKYLFTNEQATDLVSKGCTLSVRLRHLGNGETGSGFRVLLRIPGHGSVQLATFTQASDGAVFLTCYDSVKKEAVKHLLPGGPEKYAAIEAVFRPDASGDGPGKVTITVDKQPAFDLGLARVNSHHAQVEIGGADARVGHNRISDFKLTIP